MISTDMISSDLGKAGDLMLVLTTMPDDERAAELANTLVAEGLAACVNVHANMISTYRWKGAVEREAERQIIIKTTRDRLSALGRRLEELHPYELPEFITLAADASTEYGKWVRGETR